MLGIPNITETKMHISSIAKYIDQPYILLNLQKKMPAFLTASAIAYGTCDTFKQPEGKKTKQAVKNTFIFSFIITSLLYGGKMIKVGGKQLIETTNAIKTVLKQKRAVREYLEKNGLDFEQECIFEDCKHRRSLPFDFYIQKPH